VPTLLFINTDGTVVDRIDGGEDVASVTQCYSKLVSATSSSPIRNESAQQEREEATEHTAQQALNNRLRSLVASSPIMLFQKGTPNAPKCGFSRQAIEMLTAANVSFGYFNILEDDEVRQGLKSYSDWPTYPQIYVNGELVGGLDIMKELAEEDGGLVKQLELEDFVIKTGDVAIVAVNKPKEALLDERLGRLINRHRIMVFMKGIPSSPKCGFSRQIVEILDSLNASYDAFNILEDEEVRQGLKKYSDWPTYPQLYLGGELIGGLDILKEMQESGDMDDLLEG
jgi:Grx4 family monothiol glutaredoxin